MAGKDVYSIGILALQGDFEAHEKALSRVSLEGRPVYTAAEVLASDGLVLPGGESTTMWKLMEGTGIEAAIRDVVEAGKPVFATCAGAIMLSCSITNPERHGMGLLDAIAVRNYYGRQLESTVLKLTDISAAELGEDPLEAVFIRAPRLTGLGPGIEVLARRDADPVLVRSGKILAATFHPELSTDKRVHFLFKRMFAEI